MSWERDLNGGGTKSDPETAFSGISREFDLIRGQTKRKTTARRISPKQDSEFFGIALALTLRLLQDRIAWRLSREIVIP